MEKSVVRDSKFRNVFSKTWKKELFYTNLKVNVSGGEDVFRANSKFFAVPWNAAGGTLAVVPLKTPGKVADQQPLICGHTDQVTAVDFNPFDECMVATGSRDTTVKLWKVPEAGLTASMSEPLAVLNSHTKKINNLSFNPIASNILLTSAGDYSTRLWDIEANQEPLVLTGHEDAIASVSWDISGGAKLLATACKDRKMRIYDPRAGSAPTKECIPHESAQGFKMLWLEGRDMNLLYTIGFTKTKARQQALWDPRKLIEPVHSSLVTGMDGAGLLVPYFDSVTNIVFLSGKGDCISYYELEKYPPNSHYINKSQFQTTHSSVCLLPRRVNDVSVCEVDRFVRLANNAVETVSFHVPRKTQATHFQSDLYPPVPSGQPGLNGNEWLKGKNSLLPVVPVTKPEGLLEEVREESVNTSASSVLSESGQIEADRVVIEGVMALEVPGWIFNTQEYRYFSVSNRSLHCFPSKDAAAPLFIIKLSDMSSVTADVNSDTKLTVVAGNKTYKLQASTQRDRDKWLKALNSSPEDAPTPSKQAEQVIHTGSMRQHIPGYLFDSAEERSFDVAGGVLSGYKPGTVRGQVAPVEVIHLEKVVGLRATDDVFNSGGYSFQISTTTRVLHLQTPSKEERTQWMNVIRKHMRVDAGSMRLLDSKSSELTKSAEIADTDQPQSEVGEEDSLTNQITMEGYAQRKNKGLYSMLGAWSKCYMCLIGDDLFIFKDRKAVTPDLRIQMGSVAHVTKSLSELLDYHVELNNGEICEFRAVSKDECVKWVEKLEVTRKRSAVVSKLLAFIGEGGVDEEEEKKHSNLLDPSLIKSGKQKVLYHVKGKRRVYVCVAQLTNTDLNTHNTFVLDAGGSLYQWLGAKSSRVARAKAVDVCSRIRREERGGKANVVVLEEGKTDDNSEFWRILGGKPATTAVFSTSKAIIDTAADQDKEDIITTIYWVGSSSRSNVPQLLIVEECTGHRLPKKEVLNTSGVYVVDCTDIVFCWVGKASQASSRKYGMKIAFGLASQKSKPAYVMRVLEFGETNIFKEKFSNYPGMLPISTTKMELKSNVAAAQSIIKLDELVASVLTRKIPKVEEIPIVKEFRIKVWKITEFEKTVYPVALYGQFFSGDSYIVHYCYNNGAKDAHILYYYLGSDASVNEKGTVAYLTVELNDAIGGDSIQTRVVQNKEPKHFLEIFKGKYIVHKGKYSGDITPTQNSMYDVRGTDASNTRVVETEMTAKSLNSEHAYILRTPTHIFVWNGKCSLPIERETALAAVKLFDSTSEVVVMEEEKELPLFWGALNVSDRQLTARTEVYCYVPRPRSDRYQPRLLVCVTGSGRFEVEEELSFSQEDLPLEGAAILDVYDVVFVWLGKRSPHNIRKTAMELAIEYVKKSVYKHASTTPVLVVEPMREPAEFKVQFRAWSYSKYPNKKVVEESPGLPVDQVLQHYLREAYTYDELLADPLPPGIDATKLENYLTDEDFVTVFNMQRAEFNKLPIWKREALKKDVFLF